MAFRQKAPNFAIFFSLEKGQILRKFSRKLRLRPNGQLLARRRGAAGIGLGTKAQYLRRTTSGAAGNGLGTKIHYLRRTTSGAAGNSLGTTAKYL
jgi:hypothetical protein